MYMCMYRVYTYACRFKRKLALFCFQCLSNTEPLTEYFVGIKDNEKPYKKHINKMNPLGMGGAIAESYGALLEEMWSGNCSCVAPRHFKVTEVT